MGKNYWQESLKMKKKLVFTSQKIGCSLARIISLFENCLPVIPVIVFIAQK